MVNPASLIEKTKEHARDRVLKDAEIRKLFASTTTLTEIEQDLIKFIWITGARAGEACAIHWDEIHGDEWLLPGERSKNKQAHRFMLPEQAQSILAKHTGGGYVFKNDATDKGHVRADSLAKALKAALPTLKLEDAHLHDARNNLTTWLGDNFL